jgi:hypothetical protein
MYTMDSGLSMPVMRVSSGAQSACCSRSTTFHFLPTAGKECRPPRLAVHQGPSADIMQRAGAQSRDLAQIETSLLVHCMDVSISVNIIHRCAELAGLSRKICGFFSYSQLRITLFFVAIYNFRECSIARFPSKLSVLRATTHGKSVSHTRKVCVKSATYKGISAIE